MDTTTAPCALPPTVNMHVVGHCNYRCRFCYARFVTAQELLPLDDALRIMDALCARGVRRITFAGGEPTLHPDLVPLLRGASERGLVTSLVTNGSLLDRARLRDVLPWLRWLVLSCDSADAATCDRLGRRPVRLTMAQPDRVRRVCDDVHAWNRAHSNAERVRLKLNMVVTAINADEDPTAWIRACAPDRVKLLQCLVVPGENDDAADLECPPDAFARYAARVATLDCPELRVVAESTDDLLDTYAMIDPRGRFRQGTPHGYVVSAPILEVGVDAAWREVGGCDLAGFARRGGDYDDGPIASGRRLPIIAIEGLDGSGKSTTVAAVAHRLGAPIVASPPESMRSERAAHDALPPPARRDWYHRANTAAMQEAIDHIFAGRPVVMDRSFASTLAYGAAELGRIADPAEIPKTQPRPDVMVFLDVSEPTRQHRLQARGGTRTPEEDRLTSDPDFRARIRAGYLALGARVVSADESIDAVTDAILRAARA